MGGDPVTPLCSCRGIRKRPVPKPCRFNAAPNQSHAGQKTPGQKPPPAQSHFQSKAGPVQNHAGPKAASLFRPCRWVRNHQPAPKTPGKSGSAKSPPQDAQLKPGKTRYQGQPEKTPGPAKDARQMRRQRPARKYRPAKTGPKDPLRTQHPERPPCKPSCGPKIAGKFGVPQQNRYLRTYRTTPAAGQYSRPSDRLPGKSTA